MIDSKRVLIAKNFKWLISLFYIIDNDRITVKYLSHLFSPLEGP